MVAELTGSALLFDNIKDYTKGYRIITNMLHREDFQKIAFYIPEELNTSEAVKYLKEKMNMFPPIPPKEVNKGVIMENIAGGNKVDILKFPVPKWHELDGGRYIGTGVITSTVPKAKWSIDVPGTK